MAVTRASELVRLIKKSTSEDEAIRLYSGTLGFSSIWVSSVFKSKRDLPELDFFFDVHTVGVTTLSTIGVGPSVQGEMFEKWGSLSDDQKAQWVVDWKKLDIDDLEDIGAFVKAIAVFLSKV